MLNRENLIKIGRAGGNTSNWETPDQIGRVGMSEIIIHVHDNCSELKTKATLQSYEVKHGQPLTCYYFYLTVHLNLTLNSLEKSQFMSLVE